MGITLKASLQQWQTTYRQLETVRSCLTYQSAFRVIPKSVQVASSTECLNAVKTNLNLWLNNTDSQWQTIRDGLIAFANQFGSEEVQIIINAQNIDLCRLPWQEWDLLMQYYPQTEVAISTPTAKDIALATTPNIVKSKKARILLVVGKSDGINTASDLQVIQQLLGKDAEIVYLLQPSLKDLAAALWCDLGYHIFIFTGHSGSNQDGTIGWIEVNNLERLTIEEFKDSFKQAINQGLQLAIFNSCDGLGLAARLSELNLAQVIVMGEPIPDEIAIEFLSHFFREFINHNSLFSSVHKARKKLEHFNTRYPGAVWLPTLCLKPAPSYLTWQAINQPSRPIKALTNKPELTYPKISGIFGKFVQILLIIIACSLTFVFGLSLNIIFPKLDYSFISQPLDVLVDNHLNSDAKLQFPSGTWQYAGSTTWQTINNLVNQQLQQKYPNFKLTYTYHPTLPNGSGTGIKMLLDGQVSFAQSSRPAEDSEYDSAIIRGKILKQVPVAIDGIAVVINPEVNIEGLTIKQLAGIYRGKITNWGQIGGQDLEITPYARPLQSGTTEFFRNNILKDHVYGKNVVFVEESALAIKQVTNINNPGGIYFVSVAEVINNCNLKILPIARRYGTVFVGLNNPESVCILERDGNLFPGDDPLNTEVLQTGEYPLVRRLFVIIEINSPIDEEVGEAYKNFLLTKQGQELISKAGFIPIRSF